MQFSMETNFKVWENIVRTFFKIFLGINTDIPQFFQFISQQKNDNITFLRILFLNMREWK